jgi:hypothetical protein
VLLGFLAEAFYVFNRCVGVQICVVNPGRKLPDVHFISPLTMSVII